MSDSTESPAQVLRRAAELMRERAEAASSKHWGTRPWETEECADNDSGLSCRCIVSQGEHKPFDEAQVPHISYVCDAESPERAEHIASWHPGVALAVAEWLEMEADMADRRGNSGEGQTFHALNVAGAYLGVPDTGGKDITDKEDK